MVWHHRVSSANVAPDVDEFEIAGLTKAPCRLVKPPRVAESPVALECRHYLTVPLPAEDGSAKDHLVIGLVVGVYIDERFIEDGRVNTAALRPIARLGYSDYAVVSEAFSMRRPD